MRQAERAKQTRIPIVASHGNERDAPIHDRESDMAEQEERKMDKESGIATESECDAEGRLATGDGRAEFRGDKSHEEREWRMMKIRLWDKHSTMKGKKC